MYSIMKVTFFVHRQKFCCIDIAVLQSFVLNVQVGTLQGYLFTRREKINKQVFQSYPAFRFASAYRP